MLVSVRCRLGGAETCIPSEEEVVEVSSNILWFFLGCCGLLVDSFWFIFRSMGDVGHVLHKSGPWLAVFGGLADEVVALGVACGLEAEVDIHPIKTDG